MICKNGIKIRIFDHGFDTGKIFGDNTRDIILPFEIHDLVFAVALFPVSYKILTDIKIIRQTSQGLICACNNACKRIIASSVTKSSGELNEVIVFRSAIFIHALECIFNCSLKQYALLAVA